MDYAKLRDRFADELSEFYRSGILLTDISDDGK